MMNDLWKITGAAKKISTYKLINNLKLCELCDRSTFYISDLFQIAGAPQLYYSHGQGLKPRIVLAGESSSRIHPGPGHSLNSRVAK